MRAEKGDFVRRETKYLGRVVSAEGNQAGPRSSSQNPGMVAPQK